MTVRRSVESWKRLWELVFNSHVANVFAFMPLDSFLSSSASSHVRTVDSFPSSWLIEPGNDPVYPLMCFGRTTTSSDWVVIPAAAVIERSDLDKDFVESSVWIR